MDYSREKGECIYPIRPGVVIKLAKPVTKYNKHLKAKCQHECFYWVYRFSTLKPRGRNQSRRIYVHELLVPKLEGMKKHALIKSRPIQLKTLTKYMAEGYRIMREGLRFTDSHKTWVRFYSCVGLLQKPIEYSATALTGGQSNGLEQYQ